MQKKKMRLKTLVRRAEKWMHEFPLVYGFGIQSDGKLAKPYSLGIAIYHDKDMPKEDKEGIIGKFELEAPGHTFPIYWMVSTPFQMEGIANETRPHYFHRSV